MNLLFGAVEFWHWWTLAVLLVTAEAFAPGFVFGWLGIAAALTGALLFVLPGIGWQMQLLAFAGTAIASVPLWLLYVRRFARAGGDAANVLNRRGAQHIGRRCVVIEAVENGRGRVRLGDSSWVAAAPEDIPIGTRVRVVGVDNTLLLVERDDPSPPTGGP